MSIASSTVSTLSPTPRSQTVLVLAATAAVVFLAWLASGFGWRQAILAIIGTLIGATLYRSSFSFAAAYRRLFLYRETRSIEAHVLLLGFTTIFFVPLLAFGSPFGGQLAGAVAPAGISVAIGAFVFGLGMQLGGGCGSGTLYTAGGGNSRMAITLVAFCAGGFLASFHLNFWQSLPHFPDISLGESLGWVFGPALQLGLLGGIWLLLRRIGRPVSMMSGNPPSILHGPWPLAWAAVALAALNAATLIVAGHPWVITWGFTLWGAKAAALVGWSPMDDGFWSAGYPASALANSLFADTVSVMNLGILAGASLAAALAGRFAPGWRLPVGSVLAAILGGLLMGYGARLSFGCNIGAFVSGAASTSLHGWQWIVFALAGTWFGVRLRPVFGLLN